MTPKGGQVTKVREWLRTVDWWKAAMIALLLWNLVEIRKAQDLADSASDTAARAESEAESAASAARDAVVAAEQCRRS